MASASPPPAGSPEPEEESLPRERWLFLLSGALLLLALVVAIGRQRHWGEPQFAVQLMAPRADGLQEGMEVRLSGMPIGRVDSLRLQDDARVAATLQINARYRHLIGPGSRAQSALAGLVGQGFITLTPDPRPQGTPLSRPLPPLPYDPPPDVNQLVADLVRSGQKIDRTLAQASNLLQTQVPSSLGSLQSSMGKLSGSMGDLSSMSKTLASETRNTVPSVRALTTTLQRESAQLTPALRHTLAKADHTLTRADQTAGTATQASREAQLLLQQARPLLLPTLQNLQDITGATRGLVQLLGGLGLLEPGNATPRSAPPKPRPNPMDPYKAHPTSPDPSSYPP